MGDNFVNFHKKKNPKVEQATGTKMQDQNGGNCEKWEESFSDSDQGSTKGTKPKESFENHATHLNGVTAVANENGNTLASQNVQPCVTYVAEENGTFADLNNKQFEAGVTEDVTNMLMNKSEKEFKYVTKTFNVSIHENSNGDDTQVPEMTGIEKSSYIDIAEKLTDNDFLNLKISTRDPRIYAIPYSPGQNYFLDNLDLNVIKRVLLNQNLRKKYIQDESFRLATFGLSQTAFKNGVTLQLAAQGYFCDFDGIIRCAYCRSNSRTRVLGERESHDLNCVGRNSNRPVGRTIAIHYGALSSYWPLAQNLRLRHRQQVTQQEEPAHDCRLAALQNLRARVDRLLLSVSVSIRQSRVIPVPGYQTNTDVINETTLQGYDVENNMGALQSAETAENTGRMDSNTAQETMHGEENRDIPVVPQGQANRRNPVTSRQILASQNANQRTSSSTSLNTDQEATHTSSIISENECLRARILCCICIERRRNVVLLPCHHFVVCNECEKKVNICPSCNRQIVTTRMIIW